MTCPPNLTRIHRAVGSTSGRPPPNCWSIGANGDFRIGNGTPPTHGMIVPSPGHVNEPDEVRGAIGSTSTRSGNDSGAELVDQPRSAFGRLLEQQHGNEANRE